MKLNPLFTIILACFAAVSCGGDRYVLFKGYAQGGVYQVKANVAGASVGTSEMADKIEDILLAVDTTFSGYNKNSMLSRFNAGEKTVPNSMFLQLLETADRYKELSGGAFDVSAGPLFDIWGFGFSNDSLPSPEQVQAALEQCRQGRSYNFNAIAQGFTCDTIASYLKSVGVTDMLVDIGEIYCEGLNPSGKGWTIGIDTPSDGNDTPGSSLSGTWTSDGGCHGVVTSGNYRKYYVRDGQKYAHTIDPRTGYPVTHNLLSATVIAPTATDADALATFFMVIGFEQARDFILADSALEGCLITSDSTWCSPGF